MSRGPHNFKQTDVTKAIKAVEKAGVKVCRVELVKDRVIIIAGEPPSADDANKRAGEWD
jgi:hypothetical protein